jgi:hypothetical protein
MNVLPYIIGAAGGLAIFFVVRVLWLDRVNTKLKAKAYDELLKRVTDWDVRWATLSTDVSPLWATLQKKLSADLTHPEAKFHAADELFRKLEALTISATEREQLELVLRQRMVDADVSKEEQSSARIMLEVMDKVLEEAADPTVLTDVKLVGAKEKIG